MPAQVDIGAPQDSFQTALKMQYIMPTRCQLRSDLWVLQDDANSDTRFTFAQINAGGTVSAIVSVLPAEPQLCYNGMSYYLVNRNAKKALGPPGRPPRLKRGRRLRCRLGRMARLLLWDRNYWRCSLVSRPWAFDRASCNRRSLWPRANLGRNGGFRVIV